MTPAVADKTAEDILHLYDLYGAADYIGEPVSQIEHMSQSAQLAIGFGADDEVILAAFFHDIGHICVQQNADNSMEGYGLKRHEEIGADFLRSKGFPERVAKLVENHVQAKRYLTFRNPEYYASLSEASKKTLEHQGGRMSEKEAIAFESDPLFQMSIQLRRWDELAKETGVPILDLAQIRQRIKTVLLQ